MLPGSSLPCGQGMPNVTTSTGSTPQTSHTLLGQESPIGSQNNTPVQHVISDPVDTVPSMSEPKIPKSANGEGVKNSRKQVTASTSTAPDGRLCFRCKQPGHLKKDCQEPPFCSKVKTRGHIPAKCPPKRQNIGQPDERHKNVNKQPDERCRSHRENWKREQNQPQFSNKNNRCLNCVGDHRTHDCPMRQQPQTPTTSNPANGTGTYQNNAQFQTNSPQQHSQQSQSTLGISTPTLMVNDPPVQGGLHNQQQPQSTQVSQPNQQPNFQISPQHFNQKFHQPPVPQVSPLNAQPPQYNPHIPAPYFHQYPPANSPSVDSNESLLARVFHRQMDMAERQERHDMEREEREKRKEE